MVGGAAVGLTVVVGEWGLCIHRYMFMQPVLCVCVCVCLSVQVDDLRRSITIIGQKLEQVRSNHSILLTKPRNDGEWPPVLSGSAGYCQPLWVYTALPHAILELYCTHVVHSACVLCFSVM